jgi:hypothetical protein
LGLKLQTLGVMASMLSITPPRWLKSHLFFS